MSYRIDLTPNASYTETVSVSQDDVGREIAIDLYQDGTAYTIPSGTTITMQGTKPSGLGYTITGTNGTTSVTFLTTAAMTQEAGRFASELVLTNGTTVIGTANFWLFCEKNPHPANSTDGTLETIPELEQRIEALEQGASGGLTDGVKAALLQIAQKVAYIDEHGQDYVDALEDALYPPATLVSISAVYTQSGTVYDTASLDDLKADLVVTAHWSNGTTQTVTNYILSGTLTEGTSVITVTYSGKTTTFDVAVTHWEPITVTITWAGSGSDKNSQIIDATQFDLYYELPFVEGASQLVEGTTADSNAFCTYDTYLYSDAEGTTLVGRYQTDTGVIAQSGRTGAQSPDWKFNTKIKVAPQGYYAKLLIMKITSAFSSNANFMSYIQANGNKATLE